MGSNTCILGIQNAIKGFPCDRSQIKVIFDIHHSGKMSISVILCGISKFF